MSPRYAVSATLLALAISASAQTTQKKATFLTGAGPGSGRCVVEVTVDGAAEVEIRGDNGTLRNLNGQPPQWRRFECTGPMPANAPNFQFHGVDGRGRQQLMQGPQNGVALVRIEDPDNGSEGYTFEVTWGSQQGPFSRNDQGQQPRYDQGQQPRYDQGQQPRYDQNQPPRNDQRNGPNAQAYPNQNFPQGNGRDDRDNRGYRGGFMTEDAVRACQDYVRTQAARRFNAPDVIFRRTRMDDQPGRNDWVTGFFEARARNAGRARNFQFSCSVNFDTGAVRTADIKPMAYGQSAYGNAESGRAIQGCEVAVERRLTRDGFQRVDFGSVSLDDRPGRNDSVIGSASVLERGRPLWFDFSCSVNLQSGEVRSVDVNRR